MASQEDFVRNYAAKRAAQMERAKSLREQREAMSRPGGGNDYATPTSYNNMQQQQQQQQARYNEPTPTQYQQPQRGMLGGQAQPQPSPSSLAPRGYDYPPPIQQQQQQYQAPSRVESTRPRPTEPAPVVRTSQQQQQQPSYLAPSYARDDGAVERTRAAPPPAPVRSAPGPMTNGDSILVSETDFRRAVSLGVISSDQARQLWTIVSSGGSVVPAQARPAPTPQYQPPPREQPQAYDSHNYAPTRDVSDDYSSAPPPRAPPGSGQTPSRASKPQIKPNSEWNSEIDSNGDGGFGAPPPVPGRRQPVQQSKKNDPPPASKPVDLDSMPVGRRAPPEKDPYADAYPPGFGEAPASAPKQTTLAPGAANRAIAGRRAPGGKAAPPPPEPTPQGPDENELAEFLRQKEEAKARLQQELEEAAEALDEEMIECNICGRRFRESIIARHEKACKTSNKKRKVFDTKAQRLDIEGAEVIQQVAKAAAKAPPKQSAVAAARAAAGMQEKMPKWKVQHEQLQAAMQAVRAMRGDDASPGGKGGAGGGFGGGGAPMRAMPVPIQAPDDRVPCPYCNRKFAEDVAERHIPKCKTTLNRPKAVGAVRR